MLWILPSKVVFQSKIQAAIHSTTCDCRTWLTFGVQIDNRMALVKVKRTLEASSGTMRDARLFEVVFMRLCTSTENSLLLVSQEKTSTRRLKGSKIGEMKTKSRMKLEISYKRVQNPKTFCLLNVLFFLGWNICFSVTFCCEKFWLWLRNSTIFDGKVLTAFELSFSKQRTVCIYLLFIYLTLLIDG